jgi:NitT/TauT family transport system permease protein
MGKGKRNLLVAALWIGIWALVSRMVALPILLPSPLLTAQTLLRLWTTVEFWLSVGASLLRITAGFLTGAVLGLLLAVACSWSQTINNIFTPFKTLIRSTPITSFIILVLLWIHIDYVPVFISMLTVLPIVWQNTQQGIAQVDGDLLEMARAYAFPNRRVLQHIYVPSVLPYFYTACATSMGFAWKSGIAAEVIAKPLHSIGRSLQDTKVYLLTDELFAWTLTVVLLSLLLESVLRRLISPTTPERIQS